MTKFYDETMSYREYLEFADRLAGLMLEMNFEEDYVHVSKEQYESMREEIEWAKTIPSYEISSALNQLRLRTVGIINRDELEEAYIDNDIFAKGIAETEFIYK